MTSVKDAEHNYYTVYCDSTIPAISQVLPKGGYWLYNILKLTDKDGALVPSKLVRKIFALKGRAANYHDLQIVKDILIPGLRISFPQIKTSVVIIARGIGEHRLGFLISFGKVQSAVMAIWPDEARFEYERLGKSQVPKRLLKDLKTLLKPKLWLEVLILWAPD